MIDTTVALSQNIFQMTTNVLSRITELVDIASVILIVLNPDETVAFINKKGCDTLECEAGEVVGKNYFDNFIESKRRTELKSIFKAIVDGEAEPSASFENPVVTKSGALRDVKWTNSYLKDEKGKVIAVISSGEDITDRRREEAFTNAINERIADVIVINDIEGKITYVSQSVYKQLGFYAQELIGKSMIDFVHPDDRKEVMDRFFEMLNNPGKLVFSRHRVRTSFSDYKWIEGEARNMLQDPNIKGFLNNFREIGERIALEERFRVLFEQSLNPKMIVGYRGIIECNAAAVKILGARNRGELIGKMPSSLSPEYQEDGMLSTEKAMQMNLIAQQKGHHRFDWLHKTFNGDLLQVEVTVSALPSLGKDIALVSWHDLTERKMFEKQLLEAKQRAEEASKAQEQFLSTMSHEIRTPLNAIIGFSKLLLEESPREDQKGSLEALHFSSEHLLALINDVLDYSKIQAGGITLENQTFSLSRLVEGIVKSFDNVVTEKGIQIQLKVDQQIPAHIVGDQVRLAQVLTNLIGNAIKFTKEGTVKIDLQLVNDANQQVDLKFSVSDTGIGISKDKLSMIFDQFSQASTDTTRKYGGTGLGLSISKKLVELMGGKIEVESVLGKGSQFCFTLRFLKASEKANDVDKDVATKAYNPLNMRLLLVEDNEINQLVVSKFLAKWAVRVDIAESGADGIKKAKEVAYDAILMDLHLPDIDGYETARTVRENGYSGEIIALTAAVLFDVKEKVLQNGMNDIVGKPFKPEDLYDKLQQIANRRKLQGQA